MNVYLVIFNDDESYRHIKSVHKSYDNAFYVANESADDFIKDNGLDPSDKIMVLNGFRINFNWFIVQEKELLE